MPPPRHDTVPLIPAYIAHVLQAIAWAEKRHVAVVVVGQPTLNAAHRRQQQALRCVVDRRLTRVRYVDLGALIDLADTRYAVDGMHLNAAGNALIASALADPIRFAIHDASDGFSHVE